MKLDRNVHEAGRGKYALLKLRDLDRYTDPSDPFQQVAKPIADAIELLSAEGLLDWGEVMTEREFFVIRLRDQFARAALNAYADAARPYDQEYATEVSLLAARAGEQSPFKKRPD